ARAPARPETEQRAEIQSLLERKAIRIVFQPVVELATGRPAGYEALARFDGEPVRGPDEWLAQAHRAGLGAELEALAIEAALTTPGLPDNAFLAVNVSPRALLSSAVQHPLPPDLSSILIQLTHHHAFPRPRP